MRTTGGPLPGIVAGVLVVTLAASCGGDRPERAVTVREPAPTVQGDSRGTTELTQRQLESALLTVADLPTGWSVDTTSGDTGSAAGTTIEPAACEWILEGTVDEPLVEVEAHFTAGGTGPNLIQYVGVFETSATDLLDAFVEFFNQCPEGTSTSADGDTFQFTVVPLSFPNLGDQTLALRVQGPVNGINIVVDAIYVALGSSMVSLQATGLVPMQGTELEDVAVTAVERLRNAAG